MTQLDGKLSVTTPEGDEIDRLDRAAQRAGTSRIHKKGLYENSTGLGSRSTAVRSAVEYRALRFGSIHRARCADFSCNRLECSRDDHYVGTPYSRSSGGPPL